MLFQDVSLVYVLSIPDFVGAASKVAQRDGRLVEKYLFAAAVYFVPCFALSRLVSRMSASCTPEAAPVKTVRARPGPRPSRRRQR